MRHSSRTEAVKAAEEESEEEVADSEEAAAKAFVKTKVEPASRGELEALLAEANKILKALNKLVNKASTIQALNRCR